MKKTVIGFDIGGTKTAVVEGSQSGEILQRGELLTRAHEPSSRNIGRMIEAAKGIAAEAQRLNRDVVALSVSVGGPLVIGAGLLLNPPHLPGWHGVNLKECLAAGFPTLPIYVEHDGNAGALAEFHFGVGKRCPDLRNLVFLTFGTGLGAGLVVNGAILHGATDTAGEVGHWRLSQKGPFAYGKEGSWEAFASGSGLVQLAAQMYPSRWNQDTPIRELVDEMLADEPEALSVANEAGVWMGRGLALLIDALNPQMIVLGSLGVVLGDRILEPARRVVAQEALPQASAACEIVASPLGTRIGDVSALMAALTEPSVQRLLQEDPWRC
jgi:glucokinase